MRLTNTSTSVQPAAVLASSPRHLRALDAQVICLRVQCSNICSRRSTSWRGSIVIEGVHLAPNTAMRLPLEVNPHSDVLSSCSFEARRESIVIEGVHLAPNAVMRLMARHPSVVPFLVYIRCRPCWPCAPDLELCCGAVSFSTHASCCCPKHMQLAERGPQGIHGTCAETAPVMSRTY